MGIRNAFILFFLFSFLGAVCFAQESLPEPVSGTNTDASAQKEVITTYSSPVEWEPSFRLSETENNLLFYQRLVWETAQYAVSYHIILERKRETLDTYVEVLRRNVTDSFLDISIPSGEYRFRVLSFNILGLLDSESDWEYFVVLQALQPSIVEFTPQAFYFDRLTPRIITMTGENLLLDSEIYLESLTTLDEFGEPLIIRPQEIHRNELGENARLIFAEEDLAIGKYEIVVKNPGGLNTRMGVFSMSVAKPFDINVSAGYSPMLTLFGQTEHFMDRVFIPVSFSLRGSFIPFKLSFGYFGFELNASYSLLTSASDGFKTEAHLVLIHVDLLYQYWLIRRTLAINGRAGVGFAGVFNLHFVYNTGHSSDPMGIAAFTFNLGASVQWLFYKQIFIEGGVEYIHIAHPEIPMGFVRIGIFAGYQF